MTRITYAVGRTPRAGFDDRLWAMSYGSREVAHDPARDSWPELEEFAAQRCARTRTGHPAETGPLTVYVWEARTEEEYASGMIPATAVRFDYPPTSAAHPLAVAYPEVKR